MRRSFIPPAHRPAIVGAQVEALAQGFAFDFNDHLYCQANSGDFSTLCIGPRADKVLQSVDKHLSDRQRCQIVYLDDFLHSWSFSCRDGKISFVLHDLRRGNVVFTPSLIYFRAGMFTEAHPNWHGLFSLLHLLNQWPYQIFCNPLSHDFNNSKPYQMTQSLAKACQHVAQQVQLPTTYIVKSLAQFDKLAQQRTIVKSMSSTRSDVISQDLFQSWDKQALAYLPTMFQEIVEGSDWRVHKLEDYYAGKIIDKQVDANYRYKVSEENMRSLSIPDFLKKFCETVASIENSDLIGFDFLKKSSGEVYCFEANPGPGWSAFHYAEPYGEDNFLTQIISRLAC